MKCSKMTEEQIDTCIKYMDEISSKRIFSRTLDIAVGILRNFEDTWPNLPDTAKRAFVIQYGKGDLKENEKQNDSKTRNAQ